MERLAVLYCLWAFGLSGKEDYLAELDRLFLENPEDDLLLELEDLGGNTKAARMRLLWDIETRITYVDKFGAELFAALEKVYNENRFTPEDFGEMCYDLWSVLPESFANKYPFLYLCCAIDEPIFGEEHTRGWYREVFDYYRSKNEIRH